MRHWRLVDWSREQAVIVVCGPRRGWLEDDGSDANGFVRWLSGAIPGMDEGSNQVYSRPPLGHMCFGVLACTHSGYFQQTTAYAMTIHRLLETCGAEKLIDLAEVDTAQGPAVLQEVADTWCKKAAKQLVRMMQSQVLGPGNKSTGLPRAPESFDYLNVACDGEAMGWRGGDGRPPTSTKGETDLLGE